MNPDDELDPIDPPDNTGGGTSLEEDPDASDAAMPIDPPDNTGGG